MDSALKRAFDPAGIRPFNRLVRNRDIQIEICLSRCDIQGEIWASTKLLIAENFGLLTGWLEAETFRSKYASADEEGIWPKNLKRFFIGMRRSPTSVFLIRIAFPRSILDRKSSNFLPQSPNLPLQYYLSRASNNPMAKSGPPTEKNLRKFC